MLHCTDYALNCSQLDTLLIWGPNQGRVFALISLSVIATLRSQSPVLVSSLVTSWFCPVACFLITCLSWISFCLAFRTLFAPCLDYSLSVGLPVCLALWILFAVDWPTPVSGLLFCLAPIYLSATCLFLTTSFNKSFAYGSARLS